MQPFRILSLDGGGSWATVDDFAVGNFIVSPLGGGGITADTAGNVYVIERPAGAAWTVRGGKVSDARLDICTDRRARPVVAFGWINPLPRAKWIVIDQPGFRGGAKRVQLGIGPAGRRSGRRRRTRRPLLRRPRRRLALACWLSADTHAWSATFIRTAL